MRYEGCLKFGGRPEDEARSRFIRLLNNVSLEFDKKEGSVAKIVFVVEDVLAKNWIQGQIKEHSGIFDGSFNTEIIKVDPELFVQFLHKLLPDSAVDDFESKYNQILRETNRDELAKGLRTLLSSFALGAAKAGGTAAAVALLALPIFGG
jgi:hypothetical protein